ncbi:MAG: aminoacetone oxidase family FAD-binding enzyme [Clostridia bacterium]|nr:aminoacetone oxidase family FAD-binding enzyme [Clostridia bacterium]
MRTDCIILGGGAAGLAACAHLAAHGANVALVERMDRVGKKIMAAGNGRCNISNEDMRPQLYGDAAPFVSSVYQATPPDEVLSFLGTLGLMTAREEGRIYPRTMMAASVLDVLRAPLSLPHVALMTDCEARSLMPSRRGGWSVQLASGQGLFAPSVILALGGSAAPHLGTDGAGARLLDALGHSVTPLHPALVQLRSDHPALRSLKGVRVHAALSLQIDGVPAAQETGELLFADYGLSGVCVFQLSRFASPALAQKRRVQILVNFLPEIADTQSWLDARITALSTLDAQSLFTGVFPRLLAQAILRHAGIRPEAKAASLSSRERALLAQAVCAFLFEITGTQGFKSAQVTRGGASIHEVDPFTMESRLFGGLYLAGEVLDVDGPCGGYNLHFAFASGITAAKSIEAALGV